jgi:hypothetical protein
MLYPQTGRRMREAWDSPYQNAWTKFMSKGHYLQITSVLHFNDNNEVGKMEKDSLHKIRPLLAIMKKKQSVIMCILGGSTLLMQLLWLAGPVMVGTSLYTTGQNLPVNSTSRYI